MTRALRVAGAAVVLAGAIAAGCGPADPPVARTDASAVARAGGSGGVEARRARQAWQARETRAAQDAQRTWRTFALNGLLATWLDPDAVPLRWRAASDVAPCAQTVRVAVQGTPMVEGDFVPTEPFHVGLDLDHCLPFGPESIGLTGRVDLHVRAEAGRLVARVVPTRLVVTTASGARVATDEPFEAVLRLDERPDAAAAARTPASP